MEHPVKRAKGAEAIEVSAAGVLKLYCDLTHVRDEGLHKLSKKVLIRDQMEDPLCSLILKALKSGRPDLLLVNIPREAHLVHKEWDQSQLHDGVGLPEGPL